MQIASKLTLAFALCATLAACGGGGDSTPVSAAPAPVPAPAPTPAPAPSPAPAPAPAPSGQALPALLVGPIDTQVVAQNNSGDDTTVAVPSATGMAYNQQAFSFPTLLANGTAYSVALKTQPAAQLCSVYANATGTTPMAAGAIRIGCEWRHDLVSRNTASSKIGTFYDSNDAVLGGDATYGEGRFVAFTSSAPGIAGGNANGYRQVFWRDRYTGETRLISVNSGGTEGNNSSFVPAISADGLHVAFESYASNLVAGDTNGVRDVFVWSLDASSGATSLQRVSVGPGGIEANSESSEPTISGDGSVVAFSSGASNLTPGVVGINTINVILRDLSAGTNTLITRNSSGQGVGGARPALSENGMRLAFYSFASDIVSGDNNNLWDIFVYDRASGTSKRVSLTASGGERNQGSESRSRVVAPAISGNGRYVAYATTASNVVGGDTNDAQDVFVVDTQSGGVVRASVASDGTQGDGDSPISQGERVALSYDGAWVAFNSTSGNFGAASRNVYLRNWQTSEMRSISNADTFGVGPVSLSRNAAYVAYGAAKPLDARFSSSGLFVSFTGVGKAFAWP